MIASTRETSPHHDKTDAEKIAEIAERWKDVGMDDRDYCIRQLLKLVGPIPENRS